MTNEAISAILDHLCNEARNSVHATFGVMEFVRDVVMDSNSTLQAFAAVGTASADQLLRSIDDARQLVSNGLKEPVTLEEFDAALSAGEIIGVLNLSAGPGAPRLVLDTPSELLLVRQDRNSMEQVFMRVLNSALKLSPSGEVHVMLTSIRGESGVRLAVAARDAEVAVSLTKWLNTTPEEAVLSNPDEVPMAVAVMVAGKRLRAMGGTAELVRDSAWHAAVTLDLPSHAAPANTAQLPPWRQETQPGALNILIAEDCDDSFAVSELAFQNETVWRARDGQEALQMIQKQRFDAVFMDVHMPGMDGYSVIRVVREWETQTGNARVPMVVLSSDDLETQRRSAAQSGCSGYLRKPIRRGDLTNLLDRLKEARMLV